MVKKNTIFRKSLVIGIIVLFVGASIIPAIGSVSIKMQNSTKNETSFIGFNSRENTLYVGGSEPDNYSSIQSAIDDANPGDTVYVFDDSSPYYEHVIVDKSINLLGENRDTTVIDGNGWGTVVDLSADEVTLSGFTIRKGDYMKGLFVESKYNIITDNNIVDNGWIGIYLTGSLNTISNNTIKNNYHDGIYIKTSSKSNSIYDNAITKNKHGIYISGSNNNTISGNSIVNNREEGIYIICSSKHTITENTIKHNSGGGSGSSGIYMREVSDSIISGNDLINNKRGFYLQYASNNIFSRNTITNNTMDGIHLFCSSSNNITENSIAKNFECGLILRSSAKNTITGNDITNNRKYGIHLVFDLSFNNSIYHNDFIDNKQNAQDDSDIENYFDYGYPFGGNYWDEYTGEDGDGDGIGDDPYPIPGGDNEDRYPLMEPCCGSPYAPTITGPSSGNPGVEYNYTFVATDPNGDGVCYYIIWGDDTYEEWLGPYPSGEVVTIGHTWSEKGKYTIKARAKDTNGLLSPWGTLEVNMPRDKALVNSMFLWFLEQFPILQLLLQQLGLH